MMMCRRPNLQKNKLLLVPFLLGLLFLLFSWFLSYPLAIDFANDFVFYHVSILYWISLPLLLVPMYLTALTTKNYALKWIISIGIVVILYSMSYFYSMLPGSDSHYFRGMTEYVGESKNLNPTLPNHKYYQWPSFFILSYIASSISGLGITNFEFLFYTVIGFLLSASLHVYASRAYKNNGFLMVIVFFISMFYFLNYQDVPFSLALGLLFLIFMLETRKKSTGLTITIELLFAGIVLTHAFVPLFFIIYLLFRTIVDKSKYYGQLFLFALSIFLIIQLTIAHEAFATNILVLLNSSSEYSSVIQSSITPASVPVDDIAQLFSRATTIVAIAICVIGFLFLIIKRKLRNLDKALLLTGMFYTGLGVFLAALGSRAIVIAFIPVALGAVWLFESKIHPYLKKIFSAFVIVLLILFLFIPLHLSFNSSIQFQTQESYKAENFLIQHAEWEKSPYVFAYSRVIPYVQSKIAFDTPITPYLDTEGKPFDIVLYTVGLGKDLLTQNYTLQKIISEDNLNLVYSTGVSIIATRPNT